MKAKDYFIAIQQLENQIESKRYMAQTYRTLAEGIKSPVYSDMPKSSNRQLEPMAQALAKAFMLEDEISQLEQEMLFKKTQAMDIINQLEKDYQIILLKRYFEKEPWWKIERLMHYSRSWVFKLHIQALESFERYLKRL